MGDNFVVNVPYLPMSSWSSNSINLSSMFQETSDTSILIQVKWVIWKLIQLFFEVLYLIFLIFPSETGSRFYQFLRTTAQVFKKILSLHCDASW